MPNQYITPGLHPPPTVSKKTTSFIGLLVDVYGVEELPPDGPVTCLWLLHPRTRSKERMNDIACRVVYAWNKHETKIGSQSPGNKKDIIKRGLIALCFDMPNHGSRLVSQEANEAWNKGNQNHAIDMLGMVKVGVGDMRNLMDFAGGYLGLTERIDAHVCLGWSLGGHGAWQAWVGEDRVDAAVVVVGCPDTMGLMTDRARLSQLDCGGDFVGSKYFPLDLVKSCMQNDPKGLLFASGAIPSLPLSQTQQSQLRQIFDARIKRKKILCLFGADDKLVPYQNSKAFLELMRDAATGWYQDGEIEVDYGVYEGVGHAFSDKMVGDAIQFLIKVVEEGPRKRDMDSQGGQNASL